MGEPWATLDLSDAEAWQDLHPLYAAARERHPLARSAGGDGWVVLRYAEVESVLRDPRIDSQGVEMLEAQDIRTGPFHHFLQRMLFTINGPTHKRLRELVGRAFTPRTAARMRPRIREISHELIDAVEGRGEMDVVEDFAHHLPVRVISEMIGVPESDYPRFARWTSDVGLGFSPLITPEIRKKVDEAVAGLYDYVSRLVEERRPRPGDDLVSALIQAEEQGDRLSHDELLAMVVNLLFGGHDTTKSLLGIGAFTLLSHPRQSERLRREPGLAAPAVEEVLRFEPVVPSLIRKAREPLELAGVRIEAGTQLLPSLLSANRDPRQFAEADRFDIGRSENRHFGFGFGLHFCLGASLARAEAGEALPILLERLPRLELATPRPRWLPYMGIRRFESLPVRF
jgi:cytochrome P450